MDPALRGRRRQGPGAAKRQTAPYLHAAQRDVRIGRMRLRHGVLSGKRQHQVAVGADGLARVAVKLQVGFCQLVKGNRFQRRLTTKGAVPTNDALSLAFFEASQSFF